MASFVALIPKKSDPGELNDYRPISLIGCINKVVSKVLCMRLKSVLKSVISEEQTAFLAGQNILDGPIILGELISWLKKSKTDAMIYKVDIEKAFDSLSWDFLDSILPQFGFPAKWCTWVMSIVKSARASVLVNGSPTPEFVCSRGLRQGDPLSPFLFIIAMEALTGVMKKACSSGIFSGLELGHIDSPISHFLYADDVIFLGKWSLQNVLNLKHILRCFYLASGLRVNHCKSSIFGIGVEDTGIQCMANLLGCGRGSFPLKYLGLPVGVNMNLIRNWQPIVDIFRRKLASWKAKTLSYGGRISLLKSVLNSLPTYYFSLFKAPIGVIKSLEKIRRDFFWGNNDEKIRMKWVAWRKFTAPKEKGGMGFGSLQIINLALLARWWWRFKSDGQSLWRRIISFIHSSPRQLSFIPVKGSITSPWKQIAHLDRHLTDFGISLQSLFHVHPGSDSLARFWSDMWLEDSSLCSMFPNLFELETNKQVHIKDRVIVLDNRVIPCFSWSRRPSSRLEREELDCLINRMRTYDFSHEYDRWSWKIGQSGAFSVKSLRNRMDSLHFQDSACVYEWNNWVPIKVNFLAWRIPNNGLPTAVSLSQRGVNVSN